MPNAFWPLDRLKLGVLLPATQHDVHEQHRARYVRTERVSADLAGASAAFHSECVHIRIELHHDARRHSGAESVALRLPKRS